MRWLAGVTGCSLALACRVLGKPRRGLDFQRRPARGRRARRPEVAEAIRQLLGASPASSGDRRSPALLRRRGLACDPKTVWRLMRRQGWLSTGRRVGQRAGRRHEGQGQAAEPNRRWASDSPGIRAWDGQRGRRAVLRDWADRMVLAWRFAKRITAEVLAARLREAVFRRFGEARAAAQGIEFLSDKGPEDPSGRFRPFVRAMGLIPCHTPRRSPESNGLVEAFFGSFKRDYVTRPAWRRWRRWGGSSQDGSSTTTGTRPTAPWGCGHRPSSTPTGWSKPGNHLSKIRWGSTYLHGTDLTAGASHRSS